MPKPPEGKVHLGQLMGQLGRVQHVRLHQALAEVGLYRGQPPMLFALWDEDGLTHGQLAERMHVQPATISRMVQRMEKSGFVRRETDRDDQRVSRVYLTQEGQDIRESVHTTFKIIENEMVLGFSDDEIATLTLLVGRVRNNLMALLGDNQEVPRPPREPKPE